MKLTLNMHIIFPLLLEESFIIVYRDKYILKCENNTHKVYLETISSLFQPNLRNSSINKSYGYLGLNSLVFRAFKGVSIRVSFLHGKGIN